jgi:hypothetical protein
VIFGLMMVPGLLAQMWWRFSGMRRLVPIPPLVGNIMTMWWILMSLIMYRADDMASAGHILKAFVLFQADGTALLGDRLGWLLLGLLAIHYVNYKGWLADWWRRLGPMTFTTGYATACALILSMVHATAEPFVYFQF